MSGSITANRKRKRLERTLDLIAALQARHPLAFAPKNTHPVQPLAADIVTQAYESLKSTDPAVTLYEVGQAVEHWEGRKFYLKSFETATHRIDLAGHPAGTLDEVDREKALSRKQSIVSQRQINE